MSVSGTRRWLTDRASCQCQVLAHELLVKFKLPSRATQSVLQWLTPAVSLNESRRGEASRLCPVLANGSSRLVAAPVVSACCSRAVSRAAAGLRARREIVTTKPP